MTTMDPTLKELLISEVADVLAQLEDVIEKYQVNERVAYLFGLGIVDEGGVLDGTEEVTTEK